MTLFAIVLGLLAAGILLWRAKRSDRRSRSPGAPLRLLFLPFAGLLIQILSLRWSGGIERVGLFTVSQILILTFIAANWSLVPLRLFATGLFLNLLPMLANGGYMPITPETMAQIHPGSTAADWTIGLVRAGSKDIVLNAAQAPFWFLGDIFVLGSPFPLPVAYSLGDTILLLAFGWAAYSYPPMRAPMINHIELERLVSAGAVDRQFRELLLQDPLRAAEGYHSDRFSLTSEERAVLAQAQAYDYKTFVRFIAGWIVHQRSESRFE